MNNSPAVVVASDWSVTYRASALGSCTRALAAIRQDYDVVEAPDRIQEAYVAGHSAEEIGYKMWSDKGSKVIAKQQEVRIAVSGLIRVVGHIDGIVNGHVLELKSQSEGEWNEDYRSWKLWDRYSWQLSVYMLALGMPAYLTQIRRSDGKTLTHEILTPPHSLQDIRARVFNVENMACQELNELTCDRNDYPCPVFYTHTRIERELLDDDALQVLVGQHETAKLEAKRAKERQVSARNAIVEVIGLPTKLDESIRKRIGNHNVTITMYHKKGFTVKDRDEVRLTVTKVEGESADDAE